MEGSLELKREADGTDVSFWGSPAVSLLNHPKRVPSKHMGVLSLPFVLLSPFSLPFRETAPPDMP